MEVVSGRKGATGGMYLHKVEYGVGCVGEGCSGSSFLNYVEFLSIIFLPANSSTGGQDSFAGDAGCSIFPSTAFY